MAKTKKEHRGKESTLKVLKDQQKAVKAGDAKKAEALRKELFELYKPMLYHMIAEFCRKFCREDMTKFDDLFKDLVSFCYCKLCEAAQAYDTGRAEHPDTYFRKTLHHEIVLYVCDNHMIPIDDKILAKLNWLMSFMLEHGGEIDYQPDSLGVRFHWDDSACVLLPVR